MALFIYLFVSKSVVVFNHNHFPSDFRTNLTFHPADDNTLDEEALGDVKDGDTGHNYRQGSGHIPMPGGAAEGRTEHRKPQRNGE